MPETIIIHVEMDHIDYVKMQKKLIFPRFFLWCMRFSDDNFTYS